MDKKVRELGGNNVAVNYQQQKAATTREIELALEFLALLED